MKIMLSLLALCLGTQAWASLPHMDLEMTSEEYRVYLKSVEKKHSQNKFNSTVAIDDPEIIKAMTIGNRLSKWIAKINEGRTPTTAVRLTSALTRKGNPIDKPSIYNTSIIGAETTKILSELPAEMRDVLLASTELPGTVALDDATFIKHARLVDKNYQNAARYKSLNPYRDGYAQLASSDVRGYWYLTTNKIGEAELADVNTLPADKKSSIRDALIKICKNAGIGGLFGCEKKVDSAFAKNTLAEIYKKSMPSAKKTWDDFFMIPEEGVRSDVSWSGNQLTVPFNTPTIEKFIPYLRDNIQDEYRFKEWALKLNFGTFSNGPKLIFENGVVPHVNALGGNEITMDSNQPIEEYESQWTIRHEFGHVLGLPDCYHEFYDVDLKAFVNYQLDITDLMCSRAGNMKERIYLELERVYKK
jgi:hypothetical protein